MTRLLTIAIIWLGVLLHVGYAQVYQMRHYIQRCQFGRCTEHLHGNYTCVCIGELDGGYALLSAGHCFVAEPNTKLARVEMLVDGEWESVKYLRARYEVDGELDLAGLEYRGQRQLRALPIETEGERFGATVSGYWNGKPQLVDWDVNSWTQGGDIYFDLNVHLGGVSGGAITADGELVGILSRHSGERYRNSNYLTIRKFCGDTWGFVPRGVSRQNGAKPIPVPDPLEPDLLQAIDEHIRELEQSLAEPEQAPSGPPKPLPIIADKPCGLPFCPTRSSCDCKQQFAAIWARIQQIENRPPQGGELGAPGQVGPRGPTGSPGVNSQDGRPGLPPEHEVNSDGTAVRFKQPDGSWGAWVTFSTTIEGLSEAQVIALIQQYIDQIPDDGPVVAPPGADLKKTHIVLVADQDATYWPRLRDEFKRTQGVFSAMKIANPPDFTVELPQLVIYKDGTPVRQIVGLREVSETLNRMSRGDFDL